MNKDKNKTKAIFLDRDGTLIQDNGYICRLSESAIFPFSFEAVRRMNRLGFKVIVVTNQSSIARGICTKEEVETMHRDIRQLFLKNDSIIDGFYYCPYHIDGEIEAYRIDHPWRKPAPGMLLQAAADFNITLTESYMIGDAMCDMEVGKNAGCKTILVLTGKGEETQKKLMESGVIPDRITTNILDATELFLSL
ncbi:MAG: D-glycero-alpha-D-manno-heptose-1,7-bisphosphate 7-phosphatase [Candidatus Omnitrophota bacterium]